MEWGDFPSERLESVRTGWPSYMPFGENGEMVVSHDFSAGSLLILNREEKGEGDWSEEEFFGPTGINISWNRTITSGFNHNTIQLLSLTWPTSNAGSLYEGLNGALLYSRSTNGGQSWDQENVILDGMTSADYFGFMADNYEWAENGNNIAFLVGSQWVDLFLMKSTDNGSSWTKTVIWEHPYPLIDPTNTTPTDTFYCADGAHSLCIDNSGKVHVAFGITRAYSDGAGQFWFPLVDGIGYWNEDMPTFSNNLNALNPYGDPDSELIPDYNLIGWSQDVNGNGELDVLEDWGEYYLGFSSMPQLIVDDQDNHYLIYSSVTEGYDNGIQNYRHLWARGFNNNSQSWGDFIDLNEDIVFTMTECVFPSVSPTTDINIYLLFMEDSEPGLAVRGDLDPFGENFIRYMNISKSDLIPQLDLGTLSGTVTEYTGGTPISGASIHVQGTSFNAYSSTNGSYEITDIPSGNYLVSCEKSGYVTETSSIEILGNNITYLNFQLEEPAPPTSGLIGDTRYDLQSNASMQNRIHLYDDGSIGAAWTMGFLDPAFTDRGTGYNYYDGYNWNPFPVDGIEPDRVGWPSYTPWGPNGELIVAHYSGASTDGLIISKRQNKGTGDWSFVDYYGPTSNNYYLWPRAMSGGNDYNNLHVIALTALVANGGSVYQGMDGALLYSRSPDGGQTWDQEHVLFDEINSDYFYGISGDTYEIQTQGNNVAFLVGDKWTDLVLMKSTDNGDSWSKTVIWEHPYPLYDPNGSTPTDTFYCVDGAHSLAFDQNGKVHIAFGINRSFSQGSGVSWFPLVGGIGYWNEDMPIFSNNLNALSPYGDPGTELITDYNLIGWSQDLNGNGELDILGEIGLYYLGSSSMPQLVIDEMNNIFLIYSSVTESYNNGLQDYRHLWARGSNNNGQTWGDFVDLNSELVYIFSECVFPSVSQTTDNSIHLVFMEDNEPGMAVRGDEDPFWDNYMAYMNVLKSDIITLIPGGILEGNVTDADSELPIQGATIILEGTSWSSTSDANGDYIFTNIPQGGYTANCSMMGYLNESASVVLVENMTTVQDFEMEVALGLDPPENLTATILNLDDVSLMWNVPLTGTPLGYNVYRNNTNIGFFTTTSAIDNNLQPGNYTYFATAVYSTGESVPSNTVDIIINQPLLPPINLTAEVNNNDVFLNWDPPTGIPEGEWIQWDNGMNYSAVGLVNSGTMYVASHWYPGDLIDYDGMTMTSISFFPSGDNIPTFELMVWTGEDAANLILSQPLSTYNANEFNTILLNTPITIDASTELWFGYAATHDAGYFPAGCDEGPALPFFGDMFSNDGTNWVSLSTVNPALDYNWNLAAYIEETDGEKIVNIPLQRKPTGLQETNPAQSSGVFGSNNEAKMNLTSTSKDLLYYKIYRDDILIGNTTVSYYNDIDLIPGEYEYCVSAVYDEGESDCSETVVVTIAEPCFPPENLTATLVNITDLEITWDPPATGTPDGYKIYRDGILIDFVSGTEIYIEDLFPGTYEFCVTAVCGTGESDPACADLITIMLLPPTNLEADISGSTINLSWDAPENKSLTGYNVYHQFESGNFSLFAYVTQTSCIFSDPLIGLHKFYVRAVYDQGESEPGNTVEVLITSVNEYASGDITIHPNPATDFVNIKSGVTIESLIVYDHSGRIITEDIVHDKFYKFNSSKLTSGVYFFRIKTSEGFVLKRVIIE
ncbi:MAG: carboxypeptidase-like regulatory domain-containing protein [Bacteroidales bacterium]